MSEQSENFNVKPENDNLDDDDEDGESLAESNEEE